MKFIEATSFFVRAIMFDFVNRCEDIKLKFKLAPMIHIGSKEYYHNTIENLKHCDEIFYEGINLIEKKSPIYKKLSLKNLNLTFNQYKIIANKLDLVTQSECFDLSQLEGKLIHTDFDTETGKQAWNGLGFLEKLKLTFILPLKLYIFSQGISRKIFAKHFMESSKEAYLAYGPLEDEPGTSRSFIMNEREQIIFKNIRDKIETQSKKDKTIGIIYGAGHMNSIARYLIDNFNYVPRNGKFIKVFDVI